MNVTNRQSLTTLETSIDQKTGRQLSAPQPQ